MDKFIEYVLQFLLSSGIRLVGAILIATIGFAVIKRFVRILGKTRTFNAMDVGVRNFLLSFMSVVMKVVIIFTAAGLLGVPMTNMVTLVGSCGLAIGLAVQGSLSNFAGGMMILMFKPFKIGDFIEADGFAGTVKDITMLYTRLVTVDNKYISIPNGGLSNAKVVNYSTADTRRVDFEVSTTYDVDSAMVEKLLTDIVKENELVLESPAYTVSINAYSATEIKYVVRVWTKNEHYWTVMNFLRRRIKEESNKNGIVIQAPKVDVNVIG